MLQKKLKNPSFELRSLFRIGEGVVFSSTLFTFLMVINVAQTSSLVVLPLSRKLFRKFNRFCADSWWGACVQTAKKARGIRIIVTGDSVPAGENVVLLSNHQGMTDILVLMMFAKTKNRLGDLKWFVKDGLKFVPGIGWGMLFLDCLFVKRNWETDKNKIHATFSKFLKDQIPIWLISFSEGTRIKEEKLKKSQLYAIRQGLPVLQHVLLPRTKGFVSSVFGLGNHIDAVYDITIGYPHGIPSLWQVAQGHVTEFHIHVKRFEKAQLPQEGAALSSWLMDRFVKKDQNLEYFYAHGHFPAQSDYAASDDKINKID